LTHFGARAVLSGTWCANKLVLVSKNPKAPQSTSMHLKAP
jgi:hypothetical protein